MVMDGLSLSWSRSKEIFGMAIIWLERFFSRTNE